MSWFPHTHTHIHIHTHTFSPSHSNFEINVFFFSQFPWRKKTFFWFVFKSGALTYLNGNADVIAPFESAQRAIKSGKVITKSLQTDIGNFLLNERWFTLSFFFFSEREHFEYEILNRCRMWYWVYTRGGDNRTYPLMRATLWHFSENCYMIITIRPIPRIDLYLISTHSYIL